MASSKGNAEFREGYDACQNGFGLDDNPYSNGTDEADSWLMGWNQAIADAD